MSKAVLISIKPKWCELIASGKKLVEVRKTKPKLETPFKCYIYQTKMKWLFNLLRKAGFDNLADKLLMGLGKVIGEFVCDKIITLRYSCGSYRCEGLNRVENDRIASASQLSLYDMRNYLSCNGGYAWYISDLVLYDMPRGLKGFYHYCGDDPNCDGCELLYYSNTECGKEEFCCSNMYGCKPLKRPPQSWCYVEEVEDEQREADL